MATLTQTPLHGWPHQVTPPASLMALYPLLQPTMPKTPEAVSIYIFPPRVIQATLLDKLLLLQEKMNVALEQLLTVRPSRDLCCIRSWTVNMKLAVCLNKVQTAEAIRQAKLHGTTMAYTLQKAHQESVLALEHQAVEEERWAHQAFMETFGVAMVSCSPKRHGAFLYPLQLHHQ